MGLGYQHHVLRAQFGWPHLAMGESQRPTVEVRNSRKPLRRRPTPRVRMGGCAVCRDSVDDQDAFM
jgi:hypothetical protein